MKSACRRRKLAGLPMDPVASVSLRSVLRTNPPSRSLDSLSGDPNVSRISMPGLIRCYSLQPGHLRSRRRIVFEKS
jgi:hypothetical protein